MMCSNMILLPDSSHAFELPVIKCKEIVWYIGSVRVGHPNIRWLLSILGQWLRPLLLVECFSSSIWRLVAGNGFSFRKRMEDLCPSSFQICCSETKSHLHPNLWLLCFIWDILFVCLSSVDSLLECCGVLGYYSWSHQCPGPACIHGNPGNQFWPLCRCVCPRRWYCWCLQWLQYLLHGTKRDISSSCPCSRWYFWSKTWST